MPILYCIPTCFWWRKKSTSSRKTWAFLTISLFEQSYNFLHFAQTRLYLDHLEERPATYKKWSLHRGIKLRIPTGQHVNQTVEQSVKIYSQKKWALSENINIVFNLNTPASMKISGIIWTKKEICGLRYKVRYNRKLDKNSARFLPGEMS